ncbi:hypothetical protein [uncultured Brachyspira sp.]|uniref:hypothetical protein n=1 Tax=uncultured Brachyspira sp. TaxID=221953 RepID=UPI002634E666|nr:hypothetical protein [uncultured Brachyspira sp.]
MKFNDTEIKENIDLIEVTKEEREIIIANAVKCLQKDNEKLYVTESFPMILTICEKEDKFKTYEVLHIRLYNDTLYVMFIVKDNTFLGVGIPLNINEYKDLYNLFMSKYNELLKYKEYKKYLAPLFLCRRI